MEKKKIYKTVISYTILSEELFERMSLSEIEEECTEGHFLGGEFTTTILNQELIGKNAVNAISDLGSDPEFFMMDSEGNDISDEETDENLDYLLMQGDIDLEN